MISPDIFWKSGTVARGKARSPAELRIRGALQSVLRAFADPIRRAVRGC